MRRLVAGIATLGVLLSLQLTHARDASACGSSNAASPARTVTGGASSGACANPTSPQSAYDKLRARLGGDLAKALTAQERLTIA
ncbi:MAG TPA: hypothetical protein VGD47_11240, partial [Steroidobacteraceae bacterium]